MKRATGRSLAAKPRDRMDAEAAFVAMGMLGEAVGQAHRTWRDLRRAMPSAAHHDRAEATVEGMLHPMDNPHWPQLPPGRPAPTRRNSEAHVQLCRLVVQRGPYGNTDEQAAGHLGVHSPVSATAEGRMQVL